ncbi:MAG: hypothetical protein Q7K65_01670 [Candidatus Buchananbacteria bacterium]|nr:hypothetical protein [Candidatus Buchananbacteria bacterium]
MKIKLIQYGVFLILSFILAPIIIDHQIILDGILSFDRTTFGGWLITGSASFIGLVILEYILDIDNRWHKGRKTK